MELPKWGTYFHCHVPEVVGLLQLHDQSAKKSEDCVPSSFAIALNTDWEVLHQLELVLSEGLFDGLGGLWHRQLPSMYRAPAKSSQVQLVML